MPFFITTLYALLLYSLCNVLEFFTRVNELLNYILNHISFFRLHGNHLNTRQKITLHTERISTKY